MISVVTNDSIVNLSNKVTWHIANPSKTLTFSGDSRTSDFHTTFLTNHVFQNLCFQYKDDKTSFTTDLDHDVFNFSPKSQFPGSLEGVLCLNSWVDV